MWIIAILSSAWEFKNVTPLSLAQGLMDTWHRTVVGGERRDRRVEGSQYLISNYRPRYLGRREE